MSIDLPEIKHFDDFYIWFNKDEKKEYYSTPMYFYKADFSYDFNNREKNNNKNCRTNLTCVFTDYFHNSKALTKISTPKQLYFISSIASYISQHLPGSDDISFPPETEYYHMFLPVPDILLSYF